MTTRLSETAPGVRELIPSLLRAWLLTGVVDGLFSSAQSVFAYSSTVSRLFQGVAAVFVGPASFDGGAKTVALGVLMHFGVAFGWSAVFLLLATRSARIRGLLTSWRGVFTVAALYGPCIWMVMSLAVIPLLTHRPPAITIRWWIQLIGHASELVEPATSANDGLHPPTTSLPHNSQIRWRVGRRGGATGRVLVGPDVRRSCWPGVAVPIHASRRERRHHLVQ
jgi:hypothetical protein